MGEARRLWVWLSPKFIFGFFRLTSDHTGGVAHLVQSSEPKYGMPILWGCANSTFFLALGLVSIAALGLGALYKTSSCNVDYYHF